MIILQEQEAKTANVKDCKECNDFSLIKGIPVCGFDPYRPGFPQCQKLNRELYRKDPCSPPPRKRH